MGYLFSYMDTNIPGFRKFTVGATVCTVASGYHDFRAYVTAVNTALSGTNWTCSFSTSTGLVTLDGTSAISPLTFNDRAGIYLGLGMDATNSLGGGQSYQSSSHPPGCTHLYGAIWESVDIKRERVLETTRIGRGYGYVWGGAKLWRWKLQIHPSSVLRSADTNNATFSIDKPLLHDFVSKGKIQLWMGDDDTIASDQIGGKLDGWVIGLDSINSSSAFGHVAYDATLLVAS